MWVWYQNIMDGALIFPDVSYMSWGCSIMAKITNKVMMVSVEITIIEHNNSLALETCIYSSFIWTLSNIQWEKQIK